MDFTGTLLNKLGHLPDFWWLWLIVAAGVTFLVCKASRVTTGKTVWMSLLAAYVFFILFETIIRIDVKTIGAELVPFWSYKHKNLYTEILLNYLLFIPVGVMLYGAFEEKLKLKVVFIGMALSTAIELTQLIFKLGLFEFDDIFGNTVGCLLGALIGKVVIDAVRSYRSHREQGREP